MTLQDLVKTGEASLNILSDEELRELHRILLIIFDDFSAICEENHLQYFLIGGSAIGALRHKGFIPWDDDIDVLMPRKDFEAFYRIVEEQYADKYGMLHPQSRHNYGRLIPKIRLYGTEYRTMLEQDLDECGIFLDIYLLENAYDNSLMRAVQGTMSMALGFAVACRRLYRGRKQYRQLSGGISVRVKTVLGFLISFVSLEQWVRWTDSWYDRCRNEHSRYVTVPADEKHFFGELVKREDFCTRFQVEFEGRKAYVPGNYDWYLRNRYGDYMTIPPLDKQVRNRYLNFDKGNY